MSVIQTTFPTSHNEVTNHRSKFGLQQVALARTEQQAVKSP